MNLNLEYDGVPTYGKNAKANSSFLVHTKCPYGVAYEDIKKVIDLLELKNEFHHCCKSKIKGLKLDLVVAQNRSIGHEI
jgi:hypothetical protein